MTLLDLLTFLCMLPIFIITATVIVSALIIPVALFSFVSRYTN